MAHETQIHKDQSCESVCAPLYCHLVVSGVAVVVLIVIMVLGSLGLRGSFLEFASVFCLAIAFSGLPAAFHLLNVADFLKAALFLKASWHPPRGQEVPQELLPWLITFGKYLKQIEDQHKAFVYESQVRLGVVEAKNNLAAKEVEVAKKDKELLECQLQIEKLKSPGAPVKVESAEEAIRRRTAFMDAVNEQANAKRQGGWTEAEVKDWVDHELSIYYATERQRAKAKEG